MFNALFQEHLDHSAPCASRWDGFDRGDSYDANELADWQDAQNEEFDNFVGVPTPLQHHCENFVGPFQPVDMHEDIEF